MDKTKGGVESREGEREGEKHQCVVASHEPPTGDLAQNPGMYPDWELNQWPFGLQVDAHSTEPHQPGQDIAFQNTIMKMKLSNRLGANSCIYLMYM